MSLSQPQQPNTKTNFPRALVLGSELGFLIALPLTICLIIGILIKIKLNIISENTYTSNYCRNWINGY